MTFYESNPEVRETSDEGGEFVDDGPLHADPAAGTDPTRRPTGTPPLVPDADATDAARDPERESDRRHDAESPDEGAE
jgi:hypothetical protein